MEWIQGTWLDLYGDAFLVRFVITGAIVLPVAWAIRRFLPNLWRSATHPPLDAYEVALLTGGPNRVCQAVIADLQVQNKIQLESGEVRLGDGTPPSSLLPEREPDSPGSFRRTIEGEALDAARIGTKGQEFRRVMAQQIETLRGSLVEKGYWLAEPQKTWVRLATLAPLTIWLLLGAAKIMVGIERERPVAILVVLVVVGLLATLALIWGEMRSEGARRFLGTERRSHRRDVDVLKNTDPGAVLMAVALFGPGPQDPLRHFFSGDGGGGDVVGGDGGDGGGGCSGCGGCGGCGG